MSSQMAICASLPPREHPRSPQEGEAGKAGRAAVTSLWVAGVRCYSVVSEAEAGPCPRQRCLWGPDECESWLLWAGPCLAGSVTSGKWLTLSGPWAPFPRLS